MCDYNTIFSVQLLRNCKTPGLETGPASTVQCEDDAHVSYVDLFTDLLWSDSDLKFIISAWLHAASKPIKTEG